MTPTLIRTLPLLMLLLSATTAQAASLEAAFTRWEKLRSPDTEHIRFEDGKAFLDAYPGWPEEKIIRLRTEAAALNDRPDHAAMEAFCTASPPISGRGMIACARAEIGSPEQQIAWIKQAWKQGDFNADEEERIRKSYGHLLTTEDHIARAERLLYDGSAKAAARMLPLVPNAKRTLYETRLAFLTNDRTAPSRLKKLSNAQLHDAGILFERLRWRMRRDDTGNLAELILAAPADAPYPDRWWPMRAAAAREAINKRHYKQALALVEHHGEISDTEDLAEALWLKGWLHLKQGEEESGYKDFFKLYTSVYTPVSKARAAYWAGRAAEKNGNKDIAQEWMEKAARYPTVFYGQLAHHWLHPNTPLPLPEPTTISDADKKGISEDPLAVIARALEKAGDHRMHDRFLAALAAKTTNQRDYAALAEVGREVGTLATGVEIAKLALRDNIVLLDHGWPRIALPQGLPIEPSLTLAITRQESEFDPAARSPANAQGLMQLLPTTAKQIARKLARPFHKQHSLSDPGENLILGSHYLARMIDGFDGSYILGIASYNAGPGNVRKWLAANGSPPRDLEKAIDWVEAIPFGETRNYVMRVLENVSVYRTLANPEIPLKIAEDLVR